MGKMIKLPPSSPFVSRSRSPSNAIEVNLTEPESWRKFASTSSFSRKETASISTSPGKKTEGSTNSLSFAR